MRVFFTPPVNRNNGTNDAEGFMKPDQRFHSHHQLCVLFSVWATMLTAHVVGDVLCMYAVKYWGGMWSNIHEMLKGDVLQPILDSILVGISH